MEKQDIWVVQALFADRLLAVELTVAFICISMMIQAGIDYSDIRTLRPRPSIADQYSCYL